MDNNCLIAPANFNEINTIEKKWYFIYTCFVEYMIYCSYTYRYPLLSDKQWAAVNICILSIKDPPHQNSLPLAVITNNAACNRRQNQSKSGYHFAFYRFLWFVWNKRQGEELARKNTV